MKVKRLAARLEALNTRYALILSSSGKWVGVNTGVLPIAKRLGKYQPGRESGFVDVKACSFSEYIESKMPLAGKSREANHFLQRRIRMLR